MCGICMCEYVVDVMCECVVYVMCGVCNVWNV